MGLISEMRESGKSVVLNKIDFNHISNFFKAVLSINVPLTFWLISVDEKNDDTESKSSQSGKS